MSGWNIESLGTPGKMSDDALACFPIFATELNKAATNFVAAAQTGDLYAAVRLCHRLRGSAALYGYGALAEALRQAECLIQAGQLNPSAVTDDLTAVAAHICRPLGLDVADRD